MNISFEWNARKAAENHSKHEITFEEAASAFYDSLAIIFDDDTHSENEQREIIIGHSIQGRVLLVCFVERANIVRILSARKVSQREMQDYEDFGAMKEGSPVYSLESPDEMLDEYHFDYRKAKPNRFLGRLSENTVMVALDSDVAEVFTTSDAVNQVLRALINDMPAPH